MDRDLHRAHADLDETHWWFVARRRIIERTLARHVRYRNRVLDVGCGAGGLLSMLGEFGSVFAVEADREAAKVAAERNPGAQIVTGALPEVLRNVPVVDLATAFDVIEHLDDDLACLTAIRNHLSTGGQLCVTVPALPWLWSAHDDLNEHRRRYTMRTLRTVLERADFEIVHISYFNMLLLPMVIAARLFERLRRSSGGGDFDRSLGPVDKVFEFVFGAERYLVPNFRLPLGVSLIAVARRR